MNVKIHEPHGSNNYCGPSVLSMLTGESSDHGGPLDRMLKAIACQRKNIRGYGCSDMLAALNRYGFNPKVTYSVAGAGLNPIDRNGAWHPRKTLNQWLSSEGKNRHGRTFVVAAYCHWFLVQGNRYFDRPYGFDVDIRKAPRVKRRGRMICAIEVNTEPAPSWSELLDMLPSPA